MMDRQNGNEENQVELHELLAVRRDKLEALREKGIDPFGEKFVRTHNAQHIIDNFSALEGEETVIAGRLMSMRLHGRASFADLMDSSGRIQLYFRVNTLGEQTYELVQELDIGDIVGVHGRVFRTRRGEISVEVT
ncbi:MAG TPA: lysine--tRNA ligase, partial [Firmicutes bacterium]|nr:lysine--tRNA ligase [Bacillota bacterium]